MERRFCSVRNAFIWLLILISQVTLLPKVPAEQGRELVLVTVVGSPIDTLTSRDIRRIYLGVPLQSNEVNIVPIRNTSDRLLYQIFLQKVVYLSARDYERQLISRTFRKGGQRPEEIRETRKIVDTLRANPGAITFMWADSASKFQDIKVVKSLWKGSVE